MTNKCESNSDGFRTVLTELRQSSTPGAMSPEEALNALVELVAKLYVRDLERSRIGSCLRR